ncbi:MAG: NUDIX domain-containing protein [Shimia sp.]|uniref:NUDIX domain-containing protein n=1 Tax=Shimia sp. TaxID=1954381 RepID=UPI004058E666
MREFSDFDGAKVAILRGSRVVAILRNDASDNAFPNMWDFPGGAREEGESPEQCVLRKLDEELSLKLTPEQLSWKRRFGPERQGMPVTWLFVAELPDLDEGRLRLGGAGQAWRMFDAARFLRQSNAVPHLKVQLSEYLDGRDALEG